MQNSEYWKLRFEQLEAAQNGQGAAAVAEIERQYKEAQKQIEGQIARWYQRFADNNGISLAEARQYLKGAALKEFKWDVQDYIKYGQDNALMGGWMKELENASAKYHISKLEALKIQTQQSLEVMFSKQLGTVTGAMGDVFESGYYHTAYELQKGFNIGWDVAGLDQSQIEKVLAKPWAVDGKNFSERIWGNKQKLISEVHGELTQNIMLGADPQKAIDSLAKKMKTSRYNAGRLIMTEEAYFSSAAQKDCFEELGVEQFEIAATLDSHTSDICRSLDGKHFPMKDYQPGVTAPPFHVFCRSTTVPYFDEDLGDIGERAARDEETGKTYYIPDDMNYQDWKETFVDGGDKSGFDVVDDGSTLHYKHHKEPEPTPPPKKEYLTKKKLQAKIAEADVQLEDLGIQFKVVSGGWTYEEAIKDFGSLDGLADGDDLVKLKDLHSQAEAIEAQKAEWQEKLNEKLKAEQKKALAKKQLELEAEKAAIQQQLDDFEIKTYSGIWYGKDVTTADWKGLNIAGKKQYYEGKFITETDPDLMKKYQDFYKQLEELDAEGSSYHDIQQQLKKIEQEIAKVQSDLKNVEKSGIIDTAIDDAFSQARKDAAMWAKSTKEADALLRDKCGEVWKAAKQAERRAIYDYTSGSGKFNRPLSGFQGGWGQYNNKGVGKVDLNYEGAFKEIKDMTEIISQSSYDFDVWLQRGCGTEAIESFLHLPNGTLGRMTQEQLQQFLGRDGRIYSFTSTGVAKGKGFSGNVIMNIYAPKGTQMMYAEPFSAFGNGGGKSWDGISSQSTFGYESEMIIQRGASYTITKIEKTGGTIFIDVEVHPEQGYEFVEEMADYVGK
jgi:SPP1 gp7 family putative phage head morphogenesis protein